MTAASTSIVKKSFSNTYIVPPEDQKEDGYQEIMLVAPVAKEMKGTDQYPMSGIALGGVEATVMPH